jgi:hypothetical protein
MTGSNGAAHPTETSPLLGKDVSAVIGTSSIAHSNGTVQESPTKVANGAPTDGAQDEEAGEGEEPVNPLHEGLPDVAEKLRILTPAVAIGVSRELRSRNMAMADEPSQIFLAAADQTIIVSSAGKIGSELNALNLTSWIATAYFPSNEHGESHY